MGLLPSYDEIVKWRWGVPTWRLRYKLLGGVIVLVVLLAMFGKVAGILPLNNKAKVQAKSIDVERSIVGGDMVAGDKYTFNNRIPNETNLEVERRKIILLINRSVEDGWLEIQQSFDQTNEEKDKITSRHVAKETLRSGMHIKDQADRVKEFIKKCGNVEQRVDRIIQDALIEEHEDALIKTEWLQDVRKSYASFNGFVAKMLNQAYQDGLELAKRSGNEVLWAELMK